MNTLASEATSPRRTRAAASALLVSLLALSIPVAALVASSSFAAELNDVQVAIQTAQNLPYQYTLTAYNSSGSQVADFYGSYPEASFGLPSGTYLITASAYYYQSYYCEPCPLGSGVNSSATAIRFQPPSSEYGYAVVNVTGPAQISIATSNGTELPLVSVPVHVSFFNGTAAAGAYVSAYVVGMGYSYSPNMVADGQTGADGNLTLAMPEAPIQVNAYLSVPVQPPKNLTTVVQVEVGGQKVNVTVYWQPNYIGLYGQALILPPQRGADVTLKVQQSPYPIYYGTSGQGSVTTVTTVTGTTAGLGGQTTSAGQQNKIAPFDPSAEQLSYAGPPAQVKAVHPYWALALVLVAGAGAAVAVAFGIVLGRKKPMAQSARP
ncbi:MAG: hypothetical protein JRN08_06820 [Nitrososphaerota archaeon]|nr:hypothetical protein [Nitrososphaerota archaeon]